jgi:hypothetical protein
MKDKKSEDIEVVVGDNSNLNISEVNDCVNSLRPQAKEKKKVIIPIEKKNK